MLPPAPGLFLMTMGWPSSCETRGITVRARVSPPPPGGNGTTTTTGLSGYWAMAGAGAASNAAAIRIARLRIRFLQEISSSGRSACARAHERLLDHYAISLAHAEHHAPAPPV